MLFFHTVVRRNPIIAVSAAPQVRRRPEPITAVSAATQVRRRPVYSGRLHWVHPFSPYLYVYIYIYMYIYIYICIYIFMGIVTSCFTHYTHRYSVSPLLGIP